MTRPFRFGVVAPLRTDLPTWRARVRRIADAGYSTLLSLGAREADIIALGVGPDATAEQGR